MITNYPNIESKLIINNRLVTPPAVSIMIPTYRRPTLLKRAISSALNQNCSISFEVVVVDNEPNAPYSEEVDHVVNTIGDGRVKLYRNAQNIGLYGNWNRCIELAQGERFSILNDDDLLRADWLSVVLARDHGSALVLTNVKDFRTEADIDRFLDISSCIGTHTAHKVKTAALVMGNLSTGSLGVLYKKAEAIQAGGFNENFFPSSDYIFHYEYWKLFGAFKYKPAAAFYRISENESLKPSIIEKFVKDGFHLRSSIISGLNIPKNTARFSALQRLSKLHAVHQSYNYKATFSTDLDCISTLDAVGVLLSPRVDSFLSKLYRFRAHRSITRRAIERLWILGLNKFDK